MKTVDARIFLNNRKRGQHKSIPDVANARWQAKKGIAQKNNSLDARTILEMKRNKRIFKSKPKSFLSASLNKRTPYALTKKNFERDLRVPGKHVQVSKDGSLLVTSKAKYQSNTILNIESGDYPFGTGITVTTGNKSLQMNKVTKKTMENRVEELEGMALDDLPDFKSFPCSSVSSELSHNRFQPLSSFGKQTYPMKNTMIADYLPSNSMQQSYKIRVSNLHTSVTKQDILELFSNIGVMKSAELLQAGSAMVEYYTRDDAIQACNTYHSRLLDGQPMHCALENVSNLSISHRLGGKSLPPMQKPSAAYIRPEQSFSRNNRNVQFTVKIS